MEKIDINPENLSIRPHYLFDRKTLLLTCGDFERDDYNTMTIGWGSMGTMWNRPYVSVVVRPTRYTNEFIERYDDFTITAFPQEFRHALVYLGSHSGRDSDKLDETLLIPMASKIVRSPSFEQAELSIECKLIYSATFDPNNFRDPSIELNYPAKDYHHIYYGEIVHILGTNEYYQA